MAAEITGSHRNKMIDTEHIQKLVEERLAGSDMFLVELRRLPGSVIEIIVDSDTSVGIDRCAELSKAVEAGLDRDAEDFELTVMSAGIGQPLKLLRQYRNLIGSDVEVVLLDGTKLLAELKEATEEKITVEYPEKVAVEGKKRKETVMRRCEIPLLDIKTTKEHLNFK